MGGGLMQLVAYGAQDIYLTGNPQITFFKVVYRRHTNFSMEHIQQTFKGTPGTSARVVATISRNGDLVHDCYLKVKCVAGGSATDNPNPGHNLIDNIECEIGGQLIDKHYGHWMEAHAELNEVTSRHEGNDVGHTKLGSANVADGPCFGKFQLAAGAGGFVAAGTSSMDNQFLYVPLRFWFNRHVGLSLPLIALQYHEVNIIVTLSAVWGNIASSTELWANYIYLDTDERRRFAQVSHEYLIEQVQLQEFSKVNANTSYTYKLNFNHPVKELIWTSQPTAALWGAVDGGGQLESNPAQLYDSGTTAQLKLNGHDRFAPQNIEYFTRYQIMKYHTNGNIGSLLDTVGVYSFALKPEEHQPSGTCNFSRIDSAQLVFEGMAVGADKTIYVYAVNYNVLRIMSGMGGLAYSN